MFCHAICANSLNLIVKTTAFPTFQLNVFTTFFNRKPKTWPGASTGCSTIAILTSFPSSCPLCSSSLFRRPFLTLSLCSPRTRTAQLFPFSFTPPPNIFSVTSLPPPSPLCTPPSPHLLSHLSTHPPPTLSTPSFPSPFPSFPFSTTITIALIPPTILVQYRFTNKQTHSDTKQQ